METKQILKKYPLAKTIEDLPLMHEAGKYSKGFPEGIIVHFTAGWQNSKAVDMIKYANSMGYLFFFIDEAGQVWQQFCLSGWGSHAGQSKCPVTGRESVSRYYVGIEVACAGKLSDQDGDGDRDDTWFKQMNIPHDKIRKGVINNKWQKASGEYQKFTQAQENSLKHLCVWLCENGANSDLIFSHEEVSPGRKNDVGLSLSCTMDDFRKIIKGSL